MPPGRRSDRAPLPVPEGFMSAIYAIIVFLVVLALINRVEYGRFD